MLRRFLPCTPDPFDYEFRATPYTGMGELLNRQQIKNKIARMANGLTGALFAVLADPGGLFVYSAVASAYT
jgi:hypothetical protein